MDFFAYYGSGAIFVLQRAEGFILHVSNLKPWDTGTGTRTSHCGSCR